MKGKSLLCRLGFHQWYLDSAIFCSVQRCQRCSAVDDESDAKRLALERKIWEEEGRNNSGYSATFLAVAKRLFLESPEQIY